VPNMIKIGLRAWAGTIVLPSLPHHLFLLYFVFFTLCPDETAGPIAALNGSYDAVSAKEVPFGGLDHEK